MGYRKSARRQRQGPPAAASSSRVIGAFAQQRRRIERGQSTNNVFRRSLCNMYEADDVMLRSALFLANDLSNVFRETQLRVPLPAPGDEADRIRIRRLPSDGA